MLKVVPCLLVLCAMPSHAYELTKPKVPYPLSRPTFSISGGYLAGQSNEYVYDNARTLSELNWHIDGTAIIKGEANADLSPFISIGINGWITPSMDNHATMDDYDWMNYSQSHWTHWSHHSNTMLNDANDIDINMQGWLLQNENFKAGVTLGYERSAFDYVANGGCYQYNNGANVGCINDSEPVIGYQQTFEPFYLGLASKYRKEKVDLSGRIKYSPWARAIDQDDHYLRYITFNTQTSDATFASLNLQAGYHLTPKTKLFFDGTYNYFNSGRADMLLNTNSGNYLAENAASFNNQNYLLALGLQYTMN